MPTVLQTDNRTDYEAELLTLLAGYRLLPQLRREMLIDKTIASIECTHSETAAAQQEFYSQHQLTGSTAEIPACIGHDVKFCKVI